MELFQPLLFKGPRSVSHR